MPHAIVRLNCREVLAGAHIRNGGSFYTSGMSSILGIAPMSPTTPRGPTAGFHRRVAADAEDSLTR